MYLSKKFFDKKFHKRSLWFIEKFIEWRLDILDPDVYKLLQEYEPEWIDIAANYIAATAVEDYNTNIFRKIGEEIDYLPNDYCDRAVKEHFLGTLKGMKADFLENLYEE